jgi:hypothetical protein
VSGTRDLHVPDAIKLAEAALSGPKACARLITERRAGSEEGWAVVGNDVAHTHEAHDAHDAHEEVTSPDQHRRTISPRLAVLGAFGTIISLLLMAFFGNHEGGVEKVFLVGIAGLLLLIVVVNFALKRAGLRS